MSFSAPDYLASDDSKSWTLDPSRDCVCISILSFIVNFLLSFLEFCSYLHLKFFSPAPILKAKPRSIGERTLFSRTNSLNRQNSLDLLKKWHQRPTMVEKTPPSMLVYRYESFQDRIQAVVTAIVISVHTRHSAKYFLSDKEVEKTVNCVLNAVRKMQTVTKKSVKFRFAFKQLGKFLGDIEKSRVSSVTEFLRMLAEEMIQRPDTWCIPYTHAHLRSRLVSPRILEISYATYGVFMSEGAGVSLYLMTTLWKEKNRAFNAAMTLLMYCAVERCVPSSVHEINVTEERGTERILEAVESLGKVWVLHHLLGKRHEDMFRDKFMLFATINKINEFVESSWSTDRLERVYWAIKYGRAYLERKKFQELELMREEDDLDLGDWDPRTLLSFSLSGMIQLDGGGTDLYRLTCSPEAKVHVQGQLPTPTVQHLVDLNVLNKTKDGIYEWNVLPGANKCLTTRRHQGKIIVSESAKAESFSAKPLDLII